MLEVVTLPLGEWLPDRPPTGLIGMTDAEEIIPLTEDSYAHWRALAAYSDAMTGRCIGATTFTDKDGTVNVFAGDATTLYNLNTAGGTFTDVANNSTSDYTNTALRWVFAQFGERVIATNGVDPIQSFVMGSSTDFADLAAAAPRARYCAVIKNFLMLGYVNDSGVVPQRVHWCAFDDPTDWPTLGTTDAAQKQSDNRDLHGDFGDVVGVVGNLGNADGAVIMQRGVFRVTYVGPPFVFQFDLVQGVSGCSAPGSIVTEGGICYYLSDFGFVAFDGIRAVPIGDRKIDNTFLADLNRARQGEIFGAVDPINKLIVWCYPSNGAPTTHCDRLLLFHRSLGRWTLSRQNCELVFRTMSLGYTLDGLDTIAPDIDALTTSLDSDVWVGGRLQLGAFDTSHKLAYFSGDPGRPVVKLGELEDLAMGRRGFINGLKLLGDIPSDDYQLSLEYRATQDAGFSATSGTMEGNDGFCPARLDARYARPVLRGTSATTFKSLRGVQVRLKRGGVR